MKSSVKTQSCQKAVLKRNIVKKQCQNAKLFIYAKIGLFIDRVKSPLSNEKKKFENPSSSLGDIGV